MVDERSITGSSKAEAAAINGIQLAMNAVKSPMYSVDSEFNIIAVNNALAHAIGREVGECIGRKCNTLFTTHECKHGDCAVKRAMILGDFQSQDTVGQFNGKMVPVSFDVTPIMSPTGDVSGAYNVIRDLSVPQGAAHEIRLLVHEVMEGHLTARADTSKYSGETREMLDKVNGLLDAITGSLNITSEYIDRISKGDIPPKITEKYNGDFNEIRNNLNNLIEVVNMRNADINLLISSAVDGKLDVRADTTKYTGYNGKLITNINGLLDAVIGPLNVTAEYIDRISKGDIPPKITEKYNGDFNEVRNNLNNLIEVVNMRNADINLLISSAVDGKLDVRADTTKYTGYNGKLITNINGLLDAVIGPLNVTAEYIDRISKGDIPSKITEKYNGDFNEVKNNLNYLIDIVNMRNDDIAMLTLAAAEGRLGTRADISKYLGANGKMIGGINNMLDVMVGPVNEAIRVSDEYARCNFKARVDNELPVKGEFLKFKNALNEIGTSVSSTIDLVRNQAHEYANCNFTARIDDSATVQGDFVAIRDSLNNVGDEVSHALRVVNGQVVELAANAQQANASAAEVADGSNHVATNVAAVSTNAERGAEGIRQILQAMEDLSSNVQEVAASTESVSRLARETNEISRKGAELANKAELGMASITRSSAEVDTIIGEIEAQMNKIDKIVGLISSLASQTNLLALNAAIEAARAGEAGRGFAVVASEVKSLAQESRQSAEDIAEMIGTLRKKSSQAETAMAGANREVKDGSAALEETLGLFNRIVESVDKISQSMDDVAKASEAQAAAVGEVTASIGEVSRHVQNTANEAMDAAAASEESSASVDQIARVIGNVNGIVENVSAGTAKFRV